VLTNKSIGPRIHLFNYYTVLCLYNKGRKNSYYDNYSDTGKNSSEISEVAPKEKSVKAEQSAKLSAPTLCARAATQISHPSPHGCDRSCEPNRDVETNIEPQNVCNCSLLRIHRALVRGDFLQIISESSA